MRTISSHVSAPLALRRRWPAGPPCRFEGEDAEEIALREEELAETHARLDAALDTIVQALLMIDADKRVVLFNRRLLELFNLDPDIVRPGASLAQVVAHSVARGNHPGRRFEEVEAEMIHLAASGKHVAFQQTLPDGRLVSVNWGPMPCGGWVCTYEDITARAAATARAVHLAHHDPVTGLPNRVTLQDAMAQAWPWPSQGLGLNLLCLEIDRFEAICDARGHRAGDQLLQHVGGTLSGCVRGDDLVAHLGRARFAILQRGVRGPAAALRLAERVTEAVQAPVSIDGRMIMATLSIGIAAPAGMVAGLSAQFGAEEMLRRATLALNRAAEDGGGLTQVYAPDMDRTAQARHALELDLRSALEAGQFELHYQPLVSVAQKRITGFEALLRWRHPQLGLVSPAVFIPLAETLGLIGPIGTWVLRTACAEAATWPDDVRVAVNLSPLQLAPTAGAPLPAIVADILAETGLPGRRLELEITESVRLQDNADTLALLHQLRGLGARIALDDFGTGYSSLSYLRCFPFDKLKIDQSFVRGLPAAESLAIVRAVVALGASLGMTIVAEGVELEHQLGLLAAESCHEMQGYLFSKPQPAAALPALLTAMPARVTASAGQSPAMA